MSTPQDEALTPREIVERREAALKRMLNTPHQPHKPLGKKVKEKRVKNPGRAKLKST